MAKKKKSDEKNAEDGDVLSNELQELLGKGNIKKASEIKQAEWTSSGSLSLDFITKTPFPKGCLSILHSNPGVGKSTLMLEACAVAISHGRPTYYFDVENKLNGSLLDCIKLLDREKLTIINGADAASIIDSIETIVNNSENSFIVLDSITMLCTTIEKTESVGKQTYGGGGIPAMLGRFCKKTSDKIHKSNASVIFICQRRENLNPYGAKYVIPGGKAIQFQSSQTISVNTTKNEQIKIDGEVIGHYVSCEITKNAFNRPFLKCKFPIIYGKGIDKAREILTLGAELGIVEKGKVGNWVIFGEKIRGEDKVIAYLDQNPEIIERIKNEILETMGIKDTVKEVIDEI